MYTNYLEKGNTVLLQVFFHMLNRVLESLNLLLKGLYFSVNDLPLLSSSSLSAVSLDSSSSLRN